MTRVDGEKPKPQVYGTSGYWVSLDLQAGRMGKKNRVRVGLYGCFYIGQSRGEGSFVGISIVGIRRKCNMEKP